MCHLLDMKAEFPFQENPQNISNNIPNSWEPLDHTHSEWELAKKDASIHKKNKN